MQLVVSYATTIYYVYVLKILTLFYWSTRVCLIVNVWVTMQAVNDGGVLNSHVIQPVSTMEPSTPSIVSLTKAITDGKYNN